MAYTGLAHVVGAKYSETENGIQYSNGFRYGSAVRIRIDPKYEDVSCLLYTSPSPRDTR